MTTVADYVEYNSQYDLSTPVGAGTKTFVVRKEVVQYLDLKVSHNNRYRDVTEVLYSVETTW